MPTRPNRPAGAPAFFLLRPASVWQAALPRRPRPPADDGAVRQRADD